MCRQGTGMVRAQEEPQSRQVMRNLSPPLSSPQKCKCWAGRQAKANVKMGRTQGVWGGGVWGGMHRKNKNGQKKQRQAGRRGEGKGRGQGRQAYMQAVKPVFTIHTPKTHTQAQEGQQAGR